MTGRLDGTQQAGVDAESLGIAFLMRFDFPDAVRAYHTGVGTISYNGDDYLGVGAMGGFDSIKEIAGIRPAALRASLQGLDSEHIDVALDEEYQDSDVDLYIQLFNTAGEMVGTPLKLWSGKVDQMPIELGADTAQVTAVCEGLFADFERPRVRYYTDADQQAEYPGDVGLEYVTTMADKEVDWGGTKYRPSIREQLENEGSNGYAIP